MGGAGGEMVSLAAALWDAEAMGTWMRHRVEEPPQKEGRKRDQARVKRFYELWGNRKGGQASGAPSGSPQDAKELIQVLTTIWSKGIAIRLICGIARQACICVTPYLLSRLIASSRSTGSTRYAVALVCVQLISELLQRAENAMGTAQSLDCEKLLRSVLHSSLLKGKLKSSQIGESEAIFFNDVKEVCQFGNVLQQMITLPIAMFALVGLLFPLIGWSTLVALGSTAILFLSCYAIASKPVLRSHSKLSNFRDSRLNHFQNSLDGFKNVKCHQWESIIERMLQECHRKEQDQLQIVTRLSALQFALASAILPVSVFTSFMTFAGTGHPLTPSVIYAVVSVFALLQTTILLLPLNALQSVKVFVSARRVVNTIHDKKRAIPSPPGAGSQGERRCKRLTLRIRESDRGNGRGRKVVLAEGEILCVCGRSGTGKTTLLHSILDGDDFRNVTIAVPKDYRIAYVPEKPFLTSGTIRQNIICGNAVNEKRYQQVLKACSLSTDIEMLPNKDHSRTCDVSLSGGTMNRICIARAAYSPSQVVLIDDVLSSLDPAVSQHILTYCIRGIMKKRAVMLVSCDMDVLRCFEDTLTVDTDRVSMTSTKHLCNFNASNEREYDSRDRAYFDVLPLTDRTAKCIETVRHTVLSAKSARKAQKAKLKAEQESGKPTHKRSAILCAPSYVRHSGGWVAWLALVALMSVASGLQISSLWWIGWGFAEGYETAIVGERYWAVLSVYLSGAVVAILLLLFCTLLLGVLSTKASRILYSKMVKALFNAKMVWFQSQSSDEVSKIHNDDMLVVDEKLSMNALMFLSVALYGIMLLVAVAVFIPVSLVAFATGFSVYFIIWRWTQIFKHLVAKEQMAFSVTVRTLLHESVEGLRIIKSFGWASHFARETLCAIQKDSQFGSLQRNLDLIGGLFMDLVNMVMLACLVLMIVNRKEVAGADAETGLQLVSALLSILTAKALTQALSTLSADFESVERLLKLTSSAKGQNANFEESKGFTGVQTQGWWPESGSVDIDHYSLTFNDEIFALKEVSLKINAGEIVSVVGRTGSGKSTLLAAIAGLYQNDAMSCSEGAISVDSRLLTMIPPGILRSQVVLLSQEPFVLDADIRTNLDPSGKYQDIELSSILRLVYGSLQKEVQEVETYRCTGGKLNLQTTCKALSAGEKHLLCLARALLRKPKVLLCDELTSAVDTRAREHIATLFQKCSTELNITVIFSTHDMAMAEKANKVVFLQNGYAADVTHIIRPAKKQA